MVDSGPLKPFANTGFYLTRLTKFLKCLSKQRQVWPWEANNLKTQLLNSVEISAKIFGFSTSLAWNWEYISILYKPQSTTRSIHHWSESSSKPHLYACDLISTNHTPPPYTDWLRQEQMGPDSNYPSRAPQSYCGQDMRFPQGPKEYF